MPRVKLDMPGEFPFSTDIPVRIGDINYGGHLGNDAVLAIAHEARLRFLRSMEFSEQDVAGAGLIMLDAVVVYRSEAFYGDTLRVQVALADPQTTGCDVLYLMCNAATGKEVARVKTGVAFFDYARHRVVAMPDAFRKRAL
jgi:acyl-CoA thioester hydrolase